MDFFTLLGFILVPGDLIPSVLRLRHLLKTRTLSGVSGVTVTQWAVSWWCWVAYAVLINSIPLLIVSIGTGVVEGFYLYYVVKARKVKPLTVAGFIIGGVFIVTLGVYVTPEIIAGVVTILDVIFLFPQVRKTIKEADLQGISIKAWGFDLAQDIGWITYGLGIGHPLLAGWSLFSAPLGVIILVQAIRKRKLYTNTEKQVHTNDNTETHLN